MTKENEIPKMETADDFCDAIEKLARDMVQENTRKSAKNTLGKTATPNADRLARKFELD